MTTGMQTAVGRFVWHDNSSTDVEASKGFYTKLLGWDVEVWKPGELDYQTISANGVQHGGFGEAQGGAPSHWLGHVVVDDVESAGKRAQDAGGSIVSDPMDIPEVGRILVIRDPQGAVISAYQPAGDVPVSEGVFGWDELITNDVEGAKRFYGEVFGWGTSEMDMGAGKAYTLFQVGETSVAGCMAFEEGQEMPAHWYPYLMTPDVDATTAKAKDAGATVYLEPMDVPEVGRFSVLGDPTGATFGLFQAPAS
jgi:predicted enzyme related to lactoylglutathione lyase